jgi:hypothetical protein
MGITDLIRGRSVSDARGAAQLLRSHCEALPPIADDGFGAMFDRFADAKVALPGEATHGTSEFYRARAAITRRLVEKHGYRRRRGGLAGCRPHRRLCPPPRPHAVEG